jgi:hypothetical protein
MNRDESFEQFMMKNSYEPDFFAHEMQDGDEDDIFDYEQWWVYYQQQHELENEVRESYKWRSDRL